MGEEHLRARDERSALRHGWVLCLLAGATLILHALATSPPARVAQVAPRASGRGLPSAVTLQGPGGSVTLPAFEPRVVNVWLQGCADCIPAFEAWRALQQDHIRLPYPVVNVAFGRASPAWAEKYQVHESLVFDRGGREVVNPLRIGTFTTLLLDTDGSIAHVDYPQRSGYLKRLEQAAALLKSRPAPPPPPPPPPFDPPGDPAPSVRSSLTVGAGLVGLACLWGGLLLRGGRRSRERRSSDSRVTQPARKTLAREAGVQPGQRCPFCHGELAEWDYVSRCRDCDTHYHRDCAQESRGCATLGCPSQDFY